MGKSDGEQRRDAEASPVRDEREAAADAYMKAVAAAYIVAHLHCEMEPRLLAKEEEAGALLLAHVTRLEPMRVGPGALLARPLKGTEPSDGRGWVAVFAWRSDWRGTDEADPLWEAFPSPDVLSILAGEDHSDIDQCHRWVESVWCEAMKVLAPFVDQGMVRNAPPCPPVATVGEKFSCWLARLDRALGQWCDDLRTAHVKLLARAKLAQPPTSGEGAGGTPMETVRERDPKSLLEAFEAHVSAYRDDLIPVHHDDWVAKWNELRWRWVESVRERPALRAEFLHLATLHVSDRATRLFSELERRLTAACGAVDEAMKRGATPKVERWEGGGYLDAQGRPITGLAACQRELADLRQFALAHCSLWGDLIGEPMFDRVRRVKEDSERYVNHLAVLGDRLGMADDAALADALAGARKAIKGIDALLLQGHEADLWDAAHYYLCAYHGYAPHPDATFVYTVEGVSPDGTTTWSQYLGVHGRGADMFLDSTTMATREVAGGRAGAAKLALERMRVLTEWLCREEPGATKPPDAADEQPGARQAAGAMLMNAAQLERAAKDLAVKVDSYFAYAVIHGARFYVMGGFYEIADQKGQPVPAPPAELSFDERVMFRSRQRAALAMGGKSVPVGGKSSLEALKDILDRGCFQWYPPCRAPLERLGLLTKDKHLNWGRVRNVLLVGPIARYRPLQGLIADLHHDSRIQHLWQERQDLCPEIPTPDREIAEDDWFHTARSWYKTMWDVSQELWGVVWAARDREGQAAGAAEDDRTGKPPAHAGEAAEQVPVDGAARRAQSAGVEPEVTDSADPLFTLRQYFTDRRFGRPVQKGGKQHWFVGSVCLTTAQSIGRRPPYSLKEDEGGGVLKDPYKYRLSKLLRVFPPS